MGLFDSKLKVMLHSMPKHIAFVAVPEDLTDLDVLVKNVQSTIRTCVKMKIPLVSFYVLGGQRDSRYNDYICVLMQEMYNWDFIDDEQVKLSVLGKWYDLPSRCVEWIKRVIEGTSDYDRHFVNFCVNYNGQEEILSSLRLIAKRIEMGKLDADLIDVETVKENLQTSNYIPPDLFMVTGMRPSLDGFLLWDSPKAHIHLVKRPWKKFRLVDLVKGIREYQKLRR